MQGHVAYSSSRSSSIFHSWPGDPPLWGQLPRSYYSSAEWQTCWWGMEPLQTMVQGQISGMPHKLIFYSLTLWTRQLAKLRWTGFVLQRCHGQVHDFLGGWLSQGQAERDWHSAEQDKSLLRLVPGSLSVATRNSWPLVDRWRSAWNVFARPVLSFVLPKAGCSKQGAMPWPKDVQSGAKVPLFTSPLHLCEGHVSKPKVRPLVSRRGFHETCRKDM